MRTKIIVITEKSGITLKDCMDMTDIELDEWFNDKLEFLRQVAEAVKDSVKAP